jgi:hypothetical protein
LRFLGIHQITQEEVGNKSNGTIGIKKLVDVIKLGTETPDKDQ